MVEASGENSFGGAGANASTDEGHKPSQYTGSGSGGGSDADTAREQITLAEIESCFDNLAAAAKTDKAMLSELTKNITVLTATNKTIVATNDSLIKKVNRLENDVANLKKRGGGGGGGGNPIKCNVCKGKGIAKQGRHKSDECWEQPKNAANRPEGWASVL